MRHGVLVQHDPAGYDLHYIHPDHSGAHLSCGMTPTQPISCGKQYPGQDSATAPNDTRLDLPVGRESQRNNVPEVSQGESEPLQQWKENPTQDPAEHRRKRRRLTPVPKGSVTVDGNVSSEGKKSSQRKIEWSSKSEDRRKEDVGKATDGNNADIKSGTMETRSDSVIPGPSPKSAIRKSRRRAQEDLGTDDKADTINSDSQTRYVREAQLPMQPVLVLQRNGSLKLSADEDDGHRAQDGDRVGKATTSKRNMKMKHGKFVPSLIAILRYGQSPVRREEVGTKINAALIQSSRNPANVKTHPFFMGSSATQSAQQASGRLTLNGDAGGDMASTSKESVPTAWKDIKFTKTLLQKPILGIRPIWPPLDLQHIGRTYRGDSTKTVDEHVTLPAKFKSRALHFAEADDVLRTFAKQLFSRRESIKSVLAPELELRTGRDILHILAENTANASHCSMVGTLQRAIVSGSTWFDRGEAAEQQCWTTKYAPTSWQDVLQSSCEVLHDWLKQLAVHNVKVGGEVAHVKAHEKKKSKRPKKVMDEFEDFIVHSDPEEAQDNRAPANAIMITGPSGCGKTASVYAVAKQLGFEVFEIHPGMRRSAKDIFDKVGNMTQNHLVRGGDRNGSDSSITPIESSTLQPKSLDIMQQSLVNSVGSKKPGNFDSEHKEIAKKVQKQSLILIEEVDIIFEDDKAFWAGVQNLIQQSKRPVVMTCSSLADVPMQDLDLHAVLEYRSQSNNVATEVLLHIAAAEGHILDRAALATLYTSKQDDLRASILELSFWCQMTVGSQQGGLDWLPKTVSQHQAVSKMPGRVKTCSRGTFSTGIDLMPQLTNDYEDALRYARDQLDIDYTDWDSLMVPPQGIPIEKGDDRTIGILDRTFDIYDTRSSLDVLDETIAPALSAMLIKACNNSQAFEHPRNYIASAFVQRQRPTTFLRPSTLLETLAPLQEEKPIFPPSQGRLAPSLENVCPSLTTDIAPYVRCIVAYDRNVEQQREDASGSQGTKDGKKARNTRAARAAAEGGDKAHTRTEKWFPSALDFDRVLATGNHWPLWKDSLSAADVDTETNTVHSYGSSQTSV